MWALFSGKVQYTYSKELETGYRTMSAAINAFSMQHFSIFTGFTHCFTALCTHHAPKRLFKTTLENILAQLIKIEVKKINVPLKYKRLLACMNKKLINFLCSGKIFFQ